MKKVLKDNKGMALSSILYTLLILFLALLFGILGLVSSGNQSLDKLKKDISDKLNEEVTNISPTIVVSIEENIASITLSDDKVIDYYSVKNTNAVPTTEEWTSIISSGVYSFTYSINNTDTYYVFAKDNDDNISSTSFRLE